MCVYSETCFLTLKNNIAMAFVLDSKACTMTIDVHSLPILLYGPEQTAWFRATEVAAYLGYAQPRVAVTKLLNKHYTKRLCQIAPFASMCKRDDPRARYIDANGVKILCRKSRKPQSIMLANGVGIDVDDMKTLLQETKTLAALAEIFKGEDITFQFPVGPYRVDMYLPAYNIVVECDEHGHRRYNKEHEDMRSQYIEDTIGCCFVRFDPDGKCFSIFPTANQVFRAICCCRALSRPLPWTAAETLCYCASLQGPPVSPSRLEA